MPRIDDALDHAYRAKYFSSIDLKTGNWKIQVDDKDREKTAFITPDGLYEFKVMPLGYARREQRFKESWKMC